MTATRPGQLGAVVTPKRGRPTQGVIANVRLPADTLAVVDRAAEVDGLTRAAMLREIVGHWASGRNDDA